jgi:hypothetical protein
MRNASLIDKAVQLTDHFHVLPAWGKACRINGWHSPDGTIATTNPDEVEALFVYRHPTEGEPDGIGYCTGIDIVMFDLDSQEELTRWQQAVQAGELPDTFSYMTSRTDRGETGRHVPYRCADAALFASSPLAKAYGGFTRYYPADDPKYGPLEPTEIAVVTKEQLVAFGVPLRGESAPAATAAPGNGVSRETFALHPGVAAPGVGQREQWFKSFVGVLADGGTPPDMLNYAVRAANDLFATPMPDRELRTQILPMIARWAKPDAATLPDEWTVATLEAAHAAMRPKPEALIGAWWTRGSYTILTGREGRGKSAVMAHMVDHVTRPATTIGTFMDQTTRRIPGKALWVDGELPDYVLLRRLSAMLDRGKVDVLQSLQQNQRIDLVDPHQSARLFDIAKTYDMVVLDPVADLFAMVDEIDAASWRPVNDLAIALRNEGVTVIAAMHANQEGDKVRGSTAAMANADNVLNVTDLTSQERTKCANAGQDPDTFYRLVWRKVRSAMKPTTVLYGLSERPGGSLEIQHTEFAEN